MFLIADTGSAGTKIILLATPARLSEFDDNQSVWHISNIISISIDRLLIKCTRALCDRVNPFYDYWRVYFHVYHKNDDHWRKSLLFEWWTVYNNPKTGRSSTFSSWCIRSSGGFKVRGSWVRIFSPTYSFMLSSWSFSISGCSGYIDSGHIMANLLPNHHTTFF